MALLWQQRRRWAGKNNDAVQVDNVDKLQSQIWVYGRIIWYEKHIWALSIASTCHSRSTERHQAFVYSTGQREKYSAGQWRCRKKNKIRNERTNQTFIFRFKLKWTEQRRIKWLESFLKMLYVETVNLSMNIMMRTNESMPCSIVEHSLIRLVHCVRMQAAMRARQHPKELPNACMCRKSDGNQATTCSYSAHNERCKLWITSRAACEPRTLWKRAARTQFIIKFSVRSLSIGGTERTTCARIIRTICFFYFLVDVVVVPFCVCT